MIYLLLCIVSTSLIMVVFKIAGRLKLDNFVLILVNYITAALLGYAIGGFPGRNDLSAGWLPMAIIIGILFISLFFVIAVSTQKAGIAVTTVASKMSVVIPIFFSIIYFDESLTSLKTVALVLALAAVFLTLYKPVSLKNDKSKFLAVITVPLILFFGAGLIDSLIKFTQGTTLNNEDPVLFSSVLFTISAIIGLLYLIVRKEKRQISVLRKDIIYGILLGIVNFGSLFGIIKALDSKVFDSSIVFGINNVGVVLLSVILATLIFKEKLSLVNKLGISLSISAIIILSMV